MAPSIPASSSAPTRLEARARRDSRHTRSAVAALATPPIALNTSVAAFGKPSDAAIGPTTEGPTVAAMVITV